MSLKKATRVRFSKNSEDGYTTTQTFLAGTTTLIGYVDMINMEAFITEIDVDETEFVAKLPCTSLSEGKKLVKKMLQDHGVNFYAEVRKKKETKTKKS